MQYKIIFFSLFSIIILTAPNCKKTNTKEQLPPETQEGKFTFGCKVDGKIYTASGMGGLLSNQHISYNLITSDSSIYISARNTNNPNFSFDLTIHYLGTLGTYLMKTYPYEGIFSDYSNGTIPGALNIFTTADSYIGKVTIKYFNGSYKPYNKGTIMAGTFEMDAVNGNGKIIHITEGRFDVGQ